MNSTKSPKHQSGSTSKPQRDGSSRLRSASASKQKKPSSRVRIDTLTVGELRKYAHMVTVKNEEYKQRLRTAHEMFIKLQEAYQRLKHMKHEKHADQVMSEDIEVYGEVVVERQQGTPRTCGVPGRERRLENAESGAKPSVRGSRQKRGARQSTGDQETPPSALTVSQLTGLLAFPENLHLAPLTDEDDEGDECKEGNEENERNGRKSKASGARSVDKTPGVEGGMEVSEATPPEAMTIRKRLINRITSPAWETIEKKSKLQKHVHLGYEYVPRPEDPPQGLKLSFGEPQLDEDRAFKYLEVVRKQDERAKLPAGFCADCARFYRVYAKHGNFEQANAMAQRMCGHSVHQLTSRHRQKWQAPDSPDDFWHLKPPEPHT